MSVRILLLLGLKQENNKSTDLDSFVSLKLNPSKLEKNEDVNLNLAHLLNILSELVEKIFMAAEILPP